MNFARSCWISSVVSAFSRAATASLKFIKLLLPAKLPKELVIYRQRLDVYALKGFSPLFFAEMLHLTNLTLLSKRKVNCTLKREIQPLLPICWVLCKHKTNFEIHRLKKTPFLFPIFCVESVLPTLKTKCNVTGMFESSILTKIDEIKTKTCVRLLHSHRPLSRYSLPSCQSAWVDITKLPVEQA